MPEIYFSQIREDSRVERTLLRQFRPRRIVTIGSGGCTSLSLLQDDVELVYAIDQNPAQAALIECKKAAMAHLSRDEFLAFIGESEGADRLVTYQRLAPLLPTYARAYWDAHPELLAAGVNQCGVTERFYRFIGSNLRKNVIADELWNELLSCTSIAQQVSFSQNYLQSDAWRTAVKILLSKTTHLQFFPAFMFAQARENDFGTFFESMFQRELHTRLLAQNYFFTQFLFSSYLLDQPEGTPHYLSEAGYEEARRNLDKLHIIPSTLQEALPRLDQIDAFFLSNVFDWATHQQQEEIGHALLHAKAASAVLLYRNMLASPPLSKEWSASFSVDEQLSAEMTALESSMMYRQITVGVLS
ncbi:BtaA family protein [Brevibacillus ruminantium]|uniref:BtaA family protein n=1 Tax=Brevibacillus ruminantium TaxID=2950604 RepID=A0ABY4WBZ6_9BACL|nr:DUF3419 family protein [Brevibacillus ruminantium]USG63437.1 BtaA family protein [Brevibacillus ruminantium]